MEPEIVVFFLLMSLAVPLPVASSTVCTDLPPSTLQLYSVKAIDENELYATQQELRQEFPRDFLSIRHSVMLLTSR